MDAYDHTDQISAGHSTFTRDEVAAMDLRMIRILLDLLLSEIQTERRIQSVSAYLQVLRYYAIKASLEDPSVMRMMLMAELDVVIHVTAEHCNAICSGAWSYTTPPPAESGS